MQSPENAIKQGISSKQSWQLAKDQHEQQTRTKGLYFSESMSCKYCNLDAMNQKRSKFKGRFRDVNSVVDIKAAYPIIHACHNDVVCQMASLCRGMLGLIAEPYAR